MNLNKHIISFYDSLKIPALKSGDIEILNPFRDGNARGYRNSFYDKYFNDDGPRVMLIGINPGRFGGGITGIPFTDPINLETICKIPNELQKRHELSSKFIYDMIEVLGGPERFYRSIYITAVSPLGFVSKGKNLNYYDDPELLKEWKPFMIETIRDQLAFCKKRDICFSLGQGKNFKYLNEWNDEFEIFDKIKALPHPRWIMQYRLKRKEEFIQMYGQALSEFLQ